MSVKSAERWGAVLGRFLGSVLRLRRQEIVDNIAFCLPERTPQEIQAITDGMYRNAGMLVVEFLRFKTNIGTIKDLLDWDGENPLPEILKQGKGALVLTAHIGNVELLCAMTPLFDVSLTVLTKTIKPDSLNKHVDDARRFLGVKTLPPRNSYRDCRRVLQKNEVLGFILDQNMKRNHGIFVDFFGKPACTSPGLAFLSAQSGAPVVPVFLIRLPGGRHKVKILPAIPPPPDRHPETIKAATQAYTKVIENMVREYPEQWIWMHRRWKTRPLPPEEPSNETNS